MVARESERERVSEQFRVKRAVVGESCSGSRRFIIIREPLLMFPKPSLELFPAIMLSRTPVQSSRPRLLFIRLKAGSDFHAFKYGV